MKPGNSAEIRQAFLDFFQEMGHEVVASSPLPVMDNPTLLFTNAGMNQFADVFLGKEKRSYKRAATSQKCMRVHGKHNDLENVGPSPRHHTFFEMLGNFSFGDYFKEGAIRYAYDFLTKACQIPVELLWYTVHKDDGEAYKIWVDQIGVPPERVLRMGDKTNFWMMGEVGPCGPTSEVHYDWGPEACSCGEDECSVLLDNDCDRWLEIWNLVFMQFSQDEDGTRTPLPNPGVDTGMGLERLTSVIEQEPITYRTDLFRSAGDRVQELLGDSDEERMLHETGYRVIADHSRAAAFLIADGVRPGSLGGGYVLRMIIRRAARFGRKIGFKVPFLAEICSVYIEQMGDFYPELKIQREYILNTVTQEEKQFSRTVDAALAHLDKVLARMDAAGKDEIPGDVAFDLLQTHGLPMEITRDIASEEGFLVDEAGFVAARLAHIEASGTGKFDRYESAKSVYEELLEDLTADGRLKPSGVDYDPYGESSIVATVVALVQDGRLVEQAAEGAQLELVTEATPFYVAAGGEVSDTGRIIAPSGAGEMRVDDTRMPIPGLVVHAGEVVSGEMAVGQQVRLNVDDERRWDIRRNHTATHILHRELRRKLGDHVLQHGSLVAPDRLRFDFTYGEHLPDGALMEIEDAINDVILANLQVSAEDMARQEAIGRGAMALFGEKYGDVVRTIKIGDAASPFSFELCGGLHVNRTGDIGFFRFTSEAAIGAGLRRVEAVTGRGARQLVREQFASLDRLAERLGVPLSEAESRLENLIDQNRGMQREINRLYRSQARARFEDLLQQMQQVAGIPVMSGEVDGADMEGLREMSDWFRDRIQSGVAILAAVHDERPILLAAVTEDLVERGLHAGKIIGEIAGIVGGGGGGRPTLAQAGGKKPGKLADALTAVPGVLERFVSSDRS